MLYVYFSLFGSQTNGLFCPSFRSSNSKCMKCADPSPKLKDIWNIQHLTNGVGIFKAKPFQRTKAQKSKKWWYSPQDLQNQKYCSTTTLSFRKRVQNVRLKEIRIKTRSSRSTKLQMLVESLKIAASQLLLGIFLRYSDQASEFLPTASPPFDR